MPGFGLSNSVNTAIPKELRRKNDMKTIMHDGTGGFGSVLGRVGRALAILVYAALGLTLPGNCLAGLPYSETFNSDPARTRCGGGGATMTVGGGRAVLQDTNLVPANPEDMMASWRTRCILRRKGRLGL